MKVNDRTIILTKPNSQELRNRSRSPYSLYGLMEEHRSAESEGLRFDSIKRLFCLLAIVNALCHPSSLRTSKVSRHFSSARSREPTKTTRETNFSLPLSFMHTFNQRAFLFLLRMSMMVNLRNFSGKSG